MNYNEIICGECSGILNNMPEEIVDLTVTSPPYDDIREYNGFKFDISKIVDSLWRVTKEGGIVVWVVGDQVIKGSETGTSFRQALTFIDKGFRLHDTMIYEKNTSSFPARRKGNRYTQIFEYMFVFSKGKPKTANLLCDKKNAWSGWVNWGKKTQRGKDGKLKEVSDIKPVPETSPRNNLWRYRKDEDSGLWQYSPEQTPLSDPDIKNEVWRYVVGGKYAQSDKKAYKHPATFPELLAGDHIATWTNEGDMVLDPMCGSGTTPKMAKILGRNFIGIDISSEYCDLARERVENVTL